jgi:hypothetical protein
MKNSLMACLVTVVFIVPARAETLSEIAAFAQSICGDIPEGSLTRTAIQGKVEANARVLAKILSGDANVSGSRAEEIYKGVPFDKLPASIPTVAMCKSELAKTLIQGRRSSNDAPTTTQVTTGNDSPAVSNVNGNVVINGK